MKIYIAEFNFPAYIVYFYGIMGVFDFGFLIMTIYSCKLW